MLIHRREQRMAVSHIINTKIIHKTPQDLRSDLENPECGNLSKEICSKMAKL